jgi:hypothetical protein
VQLFLGTGRKFDATLEAQIGQAGENLLGGWLFASSDDLKRAVIMADARLNSSPDFLDRNDDGNCLSLPQLIRDVNAGDADLVVLGV